MVLWSTICIRLFKNCNNRGTNFRIARFYQTIDLTEQYVIQIDPSGTGLGAVLTQNGRPILFFSKTFFPKLQTSSIYVRELHAITRAVQNGDIIYLEINLLLEHTKKSTRTHELGSSDSRSALLLSELLGYFL